MSLSEPLKTIEQYNEEIANLKDKLTKINKIADNTRVDLSNWRKDWQRSEWAKVRDLSAVQ
jgi:hypothetical protein